MFVVAVDFHIRPDQIEAFMPLMQAQAQNSLSKEPGCQTFDVCRNPDNPEHIFLYEVYDDRAAFDAHMATQHFKTFDKAVANMVKEKVVRSFERK